MAHAYCEELIRLLRLQFSSEKYHCYNGGAPPFITRGHNVE